MDLDKILEARVPESEAPSAEPAEDIILAALFSTSIVPPPPPRDHSKKRGGRNEDEASAQKREHREFEAARRASIADKEARHLSAIEFAAKASSSRVVEVEKSTTDCAVIVERSTTDGVVDAEDTTKGVQTTEGVGAGTPDPPAC